MDVELKKAYEDNTTIMQLLVDRLDTLKSEQAEFKRFLCESKSERPVEFCNFGFNVIILGVLIPILVMLILK